MLLSVQVGDVKHIVAVDTNSHLCNGQQYSGFVIRMLRVRIQLATDRAMSSIVKLTVC